MIFFFIFIFFKVINSWTFKEFQKKYSYVIEKKINQFKERKNNIKSCEIPTVDRINSNSYVIIGHAYGNVYKQNYKLNEKLINFLSNNNNKIKLVIFNGDVFRDPNESLWSYLNNTFEKLNLNYIVAPGNHDLYGSKNTKNLEKVFFKFFNYDFPLEIDDKNNQFILRNSNNNLFLNSDELKKYTQKSVFVENFFFIQHHNFLNEFRYLVHDRGKNIRLQNIKNFFNENIFDKKIEYNFIIGDSGAYKYFDRLSCRSYKNLRFIFNGLGDTNSDRIILIQNSKIKSFILKKREKLKEIDNF